MTLGVLHLTRGDGSVDPESAVTWCTSGDETPSVSISVPLAPLDLMESRHVASPPLESDAVGSQLMMVVPLSPWLMIVPLYLPVGAPRVDASPPVLVELLLVDVMFLA